MDISYYKNYFFNCIFKHIFSFKVIGANANISGFFILLHFFETYRLRTEILFHVEYAFQSESTLYSWLNVKELLA